MPSGKTVRDKKFNNINIKINGLLIDRYYLYTTKQLTNENKFETIIIYINTMRLKRISYSAVQLSEEHKYIIIQNYIKHVH